MVLEDETVMSLSPASLLRPIWALVLYTAVAFGANLAASPAVAFDRQAVEALREGDMRKLSFHAEPREVPLELVMRDASDVEHTLADWQGKWVVLNFWATWCAPCRHEMPSLDRLEAAFGGDAFAVLPLATGRNPVPAIERFYEETDLVHLPILRDPTQALSRRMGVLGLPVTVILDPAGREVARLTGDAEWDSDSARAIFAALLAGG